MIVSMCAHPDLLVELGDDHVASIVIDRCPDNYIDVELAAGIADALERFEGDIACRAIVLASNGKHFCAGARLSREADDLPTGDSNPLYAEVARMFTGSVPIVAVVQGAAIGAGLGLALAADFRVAGPDARFGATFARLGFHQGEVGFGLRLVETLHCRVGGGDGHGFSLHGAYPFVWGLENRSFPRKGGNRTACSDSCGRGGH